MSLPELCVTPERVRILYSALYKTSPFTVSEISRQAHVSKSLVSLVFFLLEKDGIIKPAKKKRIVANTLATKTIKLFLNLDGINPAIFKRFPFVQSAGVYGSFTKGTNTERSDIDFWVLIQETVEAKVAALTNALKKKYPHAQVLYLTKDKLRQLKKEDQIFYYSLAFGSITVHGRNFEDA
ncbi:nucleotidyltransferase domain-containing protein [Candidatus Woesearchaeota archaeon]|nr:nucleotidyltransferase domain-containing protein [Candidatus Woesearchaeota archaeon]